MHTDTGHRQRVKDRFRKEGLDSFDEVHALELLLFYAIPRIDTKPLARSLLDRFGSFALVLEATPEELMAVPGMGENGATFLSLVTAAGRYYQKCRTDRPVILDSVERYGSYLSDLFFGRPNGREMQGFVLQGSRRGGCELRQCTDPAGGGDRSGCECHHSDPGP